MFKSLLARGRRRRGVAGCWRGRRRIAGVGGAGGGTVGGGRGVGVRLGRLSRGGLLRLGGDLAVLSRGGGGCVGGALGAALLLRGGDLLGRVVRGGGIGRHVGDRDDGQHRHDARDRP